MPAGYSGTPLAKKLGLRDGMSVWVMNMPESVRTEVERDAQPDWRDSAIGAPHAAHIFSTNRNEMADALVSLRQEIAQDGFIWASWPKKASEVETDITEDVIRDIALPVGLVDIKVCAIDETWSGLKLVIRKELRD